MTISRCEARIAGLSAALCMLAALSGCEQPERYTIVCSMTGPGTGTGTEYRFPLDEPARRIGWSNAAGLTRIEVDEWSEARIKGRFAIGETRVAIDFDRAQNSMSLVSRNPVLGENSNRGPCHADTITAEETAQLAQATGRAP